MWDTLEWKLPFLGRMPRLDLRSYPGPSAGWAARSRFRVFCLLSEFQSGAGGDLADPAVVAEMAGAG
jgi:hypothetical protein